MIKMYQCGREEFRWQGICEYDHGNGRYRYHPDRVISDNRTWILMRPEDLATHIVTKWWILFQPELQLPEGL